MADSLQEKSIIKTKINEILQKRIGKTNKTIDAQKQKYGELIEMIGQIQESNFKFRKLQ